jgi:putative secretion ATPase (PEP-CTERM system associated)
MYETYYRLAASPFLLNPDPSFFFASRGHNSAFAHLKVGIFQGEGFIVITGEIGAGKTTVVRAMIEQLDAAKLVTAQLVSTQLEADDLLQSVATAFGLPAMNGTKAQLLATIEAFLVSLVPQGKRAVLIVDEAQNLSPRALEELRMLSNFQLGQRALLQSVLVGQPELRQLLRAPNMEQLRQRITSSYHLGPLDSDETRRYIEHRLRHVGWLGDSLIAEDAFAPIHQATGGVPRRVNSLCNRLLLYGYLNEKPVLGADDVARVVEEMRDEIGLLTVAPAVQPREDRGADAASSVMVRSLAVAAIAARLDRIEKSLSTVLDLLRVLAPAEKRSRPRAGERRTG